MPSQGLVISRVDKVTVVEVQVGSLLDEQQIDAIGRDLFALVDESDRKLLLVDFAKVRFLSSQMVGTMVELQKKSSAIGGKVVFSSLRPELQKVFKVTKLDKVLTFTKDYPTGMQKLGVRA
jgi:anti-sigma B factor antagonist